MNKIFLATLALLLCCCKKEESVPVVDDTQKIYNEIRALEDYYINALNLKSTYSMKHFYYAEDIRSYSFGQPVLTGIDAVVDHLTKQYHRTKKGTKYRFDLKEVHPGANGEHVVAIGSIFRINTDQSEKLIGNYFGYFERRNGKYVCVREMETRNPKSEK